jgi:hypothetical protein
LKKDRLGPGYCRLHITTERGEASMADYLTDLHKEVSQRGIKVGSYPHWGMNYNTVSLVGR